MTELSSAVPPSTRANFVSAFCQCVFLFVIWIPNIAYLGHYSPFLSRPTELVAEMHEHPNTFADLSKYYAVGALAHSHPKQIWDLETQAQFFRDLFHLKPTEPIYINQGQQTCEYTPQTALMMYPLAALPLNQAIVVWEILAALIAIVPLTFLLRKYNQLSYKQSIRWWLIALAAAPTWHNFYCGQTDTFIAGCLAIIFLTWENRNVVPASIAFAVASAFKPQQAIVVVLMAWFRRRFAFAVGAIIASILLLAAATALLGVDTILQYPQRLAEQQHADDTGQLFYPISVNVSILGALCYIFPREKSRLLAMPFTLLGVLAIAWIWRRAVKAGSHTYAFAYAVSLLIDLITGAHENFNDMFLLNVAFAMTVPVVWFDQLKAVKDKALRYWYLCFLLLPVVNWTILFARIFDGGVSHLPILILMLGVAYVNFSKAELAKAPRSATALSDVLEPGQ